MIDKRPVMIVLLMIALVVNMIFLVNAEQITLGTFRQDQPINLIQTCDNCTSVNITSIVYPDGSINYTVLQMTKTGTFYNYTLRNTTQVGQYIYNTVGNLNGQSVTQPVNFYINQGGQSISTAQSILYFVGFSIAVFLFILFMMLSYFIPYDNDKDIDGNLINISKLKYVKLIMIALTYMFLLLIVAMTKGLIENFLFLTGFSKMFDYIYWIMLNAIYPTIVILFVFLIINLVKDGKLRKRLERGGFYR